MGLEIRGLPWRICSAGREPGPPSQGVLDTLALRGNRPPFRGRYQAPSGVCEGCGDRIATRKARRYPLAAIAGPNLSARACLVLAPCCTRFADARASDLRGARDHLGIEGDIRAPARRLESATRRRCTVIRTATKGTRAVREGSGHSRSHHQPWRAQVTTASK